MYRLVPAEGDFAEICDECGFDGGPIDMNAAAAAFRSLGDRWTSALLYPEDLLRARPAAETWCAVEYAEHTTAAIGSIEWAAREFVAGRSPDWDTLPPDIAGEFEHDSHACDRFMVSSTLGALAAAAESMASFASRLTPEEADRRAEYSPGNVINTATVVRHALHDAEHHLLDVRRGVARLQLAAEFPETAAGG